MLIRYAYDALGRRVARGNASGTTHFGWDGDQLAVEQRESKQCVYLYHPNSFVPLAQVHDGALHHIHADHLGTPLEAINDEGRVTWRATFRTWGCLAVEDIAEIAQPIRFQGQFFDPETELHYNRYRYYDCRAGRFASNDPIGLSGGINAYSYTPNPVDWIDPLGLAATCPADPCKDLESSSAARRRVMDAAGVPRSAMPIAQRGSPEWKQYLYKVSSSSGDRYVVVSHHPKDSEHPCPHWHAAEPKAMTNEERPTTFSHGSWKYKSGGPAAMHR